jgi:phospholipid transport system substrate-binding protein
MSLKGMAAARVLAPYFFAGAVALLLQVPAAHANATTAETFVQQSVDKEFAILKDTSLGQQERETRSHALLRSVIDVKRVAMFVLGPYARDASDKQIDDFVNAFSDYFVNMFHLDQNLGGGSIAVIGATARAADDVIVTVAAANASPSTGTAMNLAFRVRKSAAGNDTIVDVLVGAISMAVTQRDEFSSYLRQHGGNIDELSAKLEESAAAK